MTVLVTNSCVGAAVAAAAAGQQGRVFALTHVVAPAAVEVAAATAAI